MAHVEKLPSGQWRARAFYKDPITGKTVRPSFTANTKSEAVRMAAEFETRKRRARVPDEITVGECIERFLRAKEKTLSPSTMTGYLWMQKNRYDEISAIPLKSLTDERLQSYVSELSARVSAKSVRNAYGLLISSIGMFSDRVYHVNLPQRKPIERHIPTDAEVKELLDAATPSMRLAIALSATGTLRRGEIPALKYKDVLRDQNAIYVHADVILGPSGYVYKEMPKSSSGTRIIELPKEIMDMIGDGDPEEFIFKANPGTIEKNFCKLRDKLGLKCRFHDLRAYSVSILHALGVPDQYLIERAGWRGDAMLKEIYRHSLSDQTKKFAAIGNTHFSEALF